MDEQILTDPMIEPKDSILENALGEKYKLFNEFSEEIKKQNFILQWNYYKDEKSWLCKVLNKKKNLGWFSVWNTGFKLTFYFMEKTIEGIYNLDINDEIKKAAKEVKPVGKLIPIIVEIKNKAKMKDGMKILEYKSKLK
jgi:hypothetical protein